MLQKGNAIKSKTLFPQSKVFAHPILESDSTDWEMNVISKDHMPSLLKSGALLVGTVQNLFTTMDTYFVGAEEYISLEPIFEDIQGK